MTDRVLLVDDDPNLLSGLQRHLRTRFDLTCAQGGAEALEAIDRASESRAPFAVVLCDMRMPGMDGVAVLTEIKRRAPETVRMMLTGNADQQTCIDAINQGSIFRFYTKPCPAERLAEGLEAGCEQYRLITAERDLLERTLAGSVKVLADVVSLNDPVAYGQAARLRDWVRLLTVEFNMPQRWQLEIAAMLIPIGLVAVPPEVLAKKRAGEPLNDVERHALDSAPEAARNLIANIPRLSKVAEIVLLQDRGYDGSGFPADGPVGEAIPFDARLLKILKDLAEATEGGLQAMAGFALLEKTPERYDPNLLARVRQCLRRCEISAPPTVVEVSVAALRPGQTVLSDIRLGNGHLILAANTQLSAVQAERIRSLMKIFTFQEPVKVRVG